jgi:septum formation topological specificity factor MinE
MIDPVDAMVNAARRKVMMRRKKNTHTEKKRAALLNLDRPALTLPSLNSSSPQIAEETGTQVSALRNPIAEFGFRARAAWRVMFPARARPASSLTPKEAGKQRLRMILVADRCGMAAASLSDMKAAVVRVLADYVEVDGGEDLVEIKVSSDQELGTVYSVAVPVRRVKPSARTMGDGRGDTVMPGPGGAEVAISWEALAEEADKDPAARFPYGV